MLFRLRLRRWHRWFVSEAGMRYFSTFGFGFVLGVPAAKAAAETVLVDKLLRLTYQVKGPDGHPLMLSDELNRLCEEEYLLSGMHLDDDEKVFIYREGHPRSAYFHLTDATFARSFGSAKVSVFGASVCLPQLLMTASLDEIRRQLSAISVWPERLALLPWRWSRLRRRLPADLSDEARDGLARTLHLSESARRFVVQRELCRANNYGRFSELIIWVWAYMLFFGGSYHMLNQTGLRRRSPGVQAAALGVLGVVSVAIHVGMRDALVLWTDVRADDLAAHLDGAHARGGIEYVEKVLQRNRLLRRLLPDGAALFTPAGDFVKRRHLAAPPTSLVVRLGKLRHYLEDVDQQRVDQHTELAEDV